MCLGSAPDAPPPPAPAPPPRFVDKSVIDARDRAKSRAGKGGIGDTISGTAEGVLDAANVIKTSLLGSDSV